MNRTGDPFCKENESDQEGKSHILFLISKSKFEYICKYMNAQTYAHTHTQTHTHTHTNKLEKDTKQSIKNMMLCINTH